MIIEIGDRFSFEAEGIYGVVDEVIRDDDGQAMSVVIEMDDGRWASVDLSLVKQVSVH